MSLDNHENRRTINDNQNLGEIPVLPTTPENPEALADHLTNEDRDALAPQVVGLYEDRNAEHTTKTKHKVLLGVMGGVATLGVAGAVVFGLNGPKAGEQNNDNLPPAPEPTAEAPVVPGESAAPTAEPTTPVEVSPTDIPTNVASPTPVETEQGAEYSVSELKEMPLQEFNKLPLDSRLVLVTDMLTESTEWNSGSFGENFTGEDTSDLYNYNPLDVASKENSLEEIAMQDLYMNQLALTQTKDLNTSGIFNADMASKALSGAVISREFVNDASNDDVSTAETDGVAEEVNHPDQYRQINANFDRLGELTLTYPQEIDYISNESEISTITDDTGKERTVAMLKYGVTFTETVGMFKEGQQVQFNKNFVYDDEHNLWLAYDGNFQMNFDK